jgi:hypothetical protein
MLGHLVLPVPKDKYQSRKEDITSSEKVRVLASCPIFDGSVTGTNQTSLNGDSYYSTN